MNKNAYYCCDDDFRDFVLGFSKELLDLTGVGPDMINPVKNYDTLWGTSSTLADVSADPSANVGQTTMASLNQEINKAELKLIGLQLVYRKAKELYGKEAAQSMLEKVFTGGLYISDLHLIGMPYCYNYPVGVLLEKGLPFIYRTPSLPAKHADTYIQHCTQLLMYASNHQSGAAALTGFFVGYAWFAEKEMLSKKEIRQHFQNLVYTLNQPVRYSAQTPFVNLSFFDRPYLEALYGGGYFRYPDGTTPNIEFIQELQKIFHDMFIGEINTKKNLITFPILSANILLDEKTRQPKDEEFVNWLTKANAPYGLINIYMSTKAGSLSSCCRLSNNLDLLAELGYVNSFGAGGDGIGSVGVCTVSFPHIALLATKNASSEYDAQARFDALLDDYVRDAQRITWIRRSFVKENIEKGFLPLYTHGFSDLDSQYCTVGICGVYEGAFFLGAGTDMKNPQVYADFVENALNRINTLNLEASKEYGCHFNLEQVPGENQAVNFAAKDRVQNLQNEFRMYSNQWIPLTTQVDPFLRIHFSGKLDAKLSGGGILHITTGSKVSAEVQKRLLFFAAKQGVVYFAFNYILSKCVCGEITPSDIHACPKCGSSNIEHFTRVVGFLTPVKSWNAERRNEFHYRVRYDIDARQKELVELVADKENEDKVSSTLQGVA